MDETVQIEPLAALGEHITASLGDAVTGFELAFGDLTVSVKRESIVEVVTFLRDDYPAREFRFDVVYHFLSPHLNQRIRVKIETDDQTAVPSITGVFPGADWFERETYDLYGVLFSGHPDLRRILTDYGFDGHPLRKDFPLSGFVEVRYDEERRRVVYEPVSLPQEFRSFDYLSPWEGTDYVLPGDEKAKN
jgi:NADH-quinone oxidoreductase subunit C